MTLLESSNTMRDAPQGYNTATFIAEDGVDSNTKQYYNFSDSGNDDEPLKRAYKKRLEQWRQEMFRNAK